MVFDVPEVGANKRLSKGAGWSGSGSGVTPLNLSLIPARALALTFSKIKLIICFWAASGVDLSGPKKLCPKVLGKNISVSTTSPLSLVWLNINDWPSLKFIGFLSSIPNSETTWFIFLKTSWSSLSFKIVIVILSSK